MVVDPKKYKNRGFVCFGSNCFRKMRKSGYFYTKYLDFKNSLYEIRHLHQSKQQNFFLDIESWLNSCSKIFVGL